MTQTSKAGSAQEIDGAGVPCPCGSADHSLALHKTRIRTRWHPVHGQYDIDDPIAEHRDGEHDAYPDPESCGACAG